MKKIGIIGCGAIGSVIARAIDDGEIEGELTALYDIIRDKCILLKNNLRKYEPIIAESFEEFINTRPELVVEAASQEAVKQYIPSLLSRGIDVVILSVGALLNKELYTKIIKICKSKRSKIYVPTGAIAGVDAIKAASIAGIKQIILVTRKNPRSISKESLRNLGITHEIRKPTTIYEGPAEEAVKMLPFNINVAAILKLASKAPVFVKVIADPGIKRNVHEITVESRASTIKIKVENIPHPQNSKTSYIAALSAIQLLKQVTGALINIGT